MDYNAIANKIEELIKADIKSKGLIKTGAMYNSMVVKEGLAQEVVVVLLA